MVDTKRALVCGVTGQDGAYLARLLIEKGYQVVGTTRGHAAHTANLALLGIDQGVQLVRMNPDKRDEVDRIVAESAAAEIYYLAAQSSVWRSFAEPVATFEASAVGLLNLLEAARIHAPKARIFNAASGDCFGETAADRPATEQTRFAPRSPYAAAKCAGHHALAVSRLGTGQFACSGFLFTHESPLRPETFAVGKTFAAAKRIAAGSDETLILGDLSVVRDWSWAPHHVEAMWKMLQLAQPEDFIIASGRSASLQSLVEAIFAALGLDWRDHVSAVPLPPRPNDIRIQHADPRRARERLGWSSDGDIGRLAQRLVGVV